jgi:hypothetical protein
VNLGAGQLYVLPKERRASPYTAEGAEVLLIEPARAEAPQCEYPAQQPVHRFEEGLDSPPSTWSGNAAAVADEKCHEGSNGTGR